MLIFTFWLLLQREVNYSCYLICSVFFCVFGNSFLYGYNIGDVNNPAKVGSCQRNETNSANVKTDTYCWHLVFELSVQISPMYNQALHQHGFVCIIRYFKQTVDNVCETNCQTSLKPRVDEHSEHTKNCYCTFCNIILQLNHNRIAYNDTRSCLSYRYIIRT